MGYPKTMWVDESERWVPLWVDAYSKKCQICVVQKSKKSGALFLLHPKGCPPLATISLGQEVALFEQEFLSAAYFKNEKLF